MLYYTLGNVLSSLILPFLRYFLTTQIACKTVADQQSDLENS